MITNLLTPQRVSPLVVLILCVALFSCNNKAKEDVTPVPEPTNQELLAGKWNLDYAILDSNKNKMFEKSEENYPGTGDQVIVELNTDGTGTTTNKFINLNNQPDQTIENFTWVILNMDQFKIIQEVQGLNGTDTSNSNVDIISISATNSTWESDYTITSGTDTTIYRQRLVMKKLQ